MSALSASRSSGAGSRPLLGAQLAQALELLGQQAALAEVARLGLLEFGHRRTAGEFGLGLRQDLVQYLHLIVVVGFVLIEGRQRRLRRMP